MATLLLQTAGAALGNAVGGPVGAVVGRAAGAVAGAYIDSALLGRAGGRATRHVEGPRLGDMPTLASTEGAPIPRVYGRARIGGQLIWATRLEEVVSTEVTRTRASGGKGSPKPPATTTVTTTYSYYANIAVGLCEGPIACVRRVWADGQELDLTTVAMRVHTGTEGQVADPLILAKEGAAPAYRGLAYVVFERLPVGPFGNRIPQLSFEVLRPVAGLAEAVKGVCLIPGSTEFGYDTIHVARVLGEGSYASENRHQLTRATDVVASLDALQALCPNLRRVAVVASWFGTDLRAGECRVEPRVDIAGKVTDGATWSVAGLGRENASPVSLSGGRAAYGGTPDDAGLVRLIGELKARGLKVALYPFILMDVPAGNALPDPWTGGTGQPAYPWRGRITCFPAPGRDGSPDGTALAGAQVSAFFGTALPGHFSATGNGVVYSGPDEWTLRRQVLHYAALAVVANGVDAIVIGSELVGLTRVRSAPGVYPAVAALMALAADVKLIAGAATAVTYAADWTEYGAHVRDGGVEVRFPLDPLWASAAVDAVGIDFYPPVSDWRDGLAHTDAEAARSAYDPAYLSAGLRSGEAFDWYYASDADRAAQVRTPITDEAYGKPWIYRAKDLRSWWSEPHVERSGGVEIAPSPWVPRSKPIWLTEIGCPAVDKGANAPNVFPDAKSAEGGLPAFSGGSRDDLIQRRLLAALLRRFDPALAGHDPADNPVSPVYGGHMVDPAATCLWCWDARPFPDFPDLSGTWADAANWERGHWLNGRLEGGGVDDLVRAILSDLACPPADRVEIDGFFDGYVIDRPMSARAALEPLALLYGFDAVVSGGRLDFRGRPGRSVATLGADDLVPGRDGAQVQITRAQETELPRELRVGFTDGEGPFRRSAARSRRLVGDSLREVQADIALVSRRAEVQRLADIWLQDLWIGRETAEFAVHPHRLDLEIGDIVAVPGAGGRLHRITRIADGAVRSIASRAIDPGIFDLAPPDLPRTPRLPPAVPGRPFAVVLDLPLALAEPPVLQWLAIRADPWTGPMAVWRSADGSSYSLFAVAAAPSVIGRTTTPLGPGPLWRFDPGAVTVSLAGGFLSSVGDAATLAGANTLAVLGPDGAWEILSAASAELVAPGTWRLTRLLRGLAGTEPAAARAVPAGAMVVALDSTLVPLAEGARDLGRTWRYRIGPADRDHADPAFREIVATPGAAALQPRAPVHLRARRLPEGVAISWVRRTRFDGDAWEPLDVPLVEAREAYRVEIRNAGDVARVLSAEIPAVLYPAAWETADFGGPTPSLDIAVAQESASVGLGAFARALVPIL